MKTTTTKAPEKKPISKPPIIDTKEKMFEAIEQIATKIIDQETSSLIKNEVPQILLSYSPDSNRGAEMGAQYINSSFEKRVLKSVEIFHKWFKDNSSNPAISQVSDILTQIGIQPETTDTSEFITAIKSNYQEKEKQGLDGAAAFLEEIKLTTSKASGWKGDPLFVYNHFINNSYKFAIDALTNYIQLNAESIPAGLIFYYWGCALQFSNKDNKDALKFYDFALKMYPFNKDPFFAKEIHKYKSACFFELKDYEGAISSLEEYIKLAPEDNKVNHAIAALNIYANNYESAIKYADISVEKGLHTSDSLAIKGLACRNLGDFKQSADNFSAAFSLNNSKGSFLRQKALSLKLLAENLPTCHPELVSGSSSYSSGSRLKEGRDDEVIKLLAETKEPVDEILSILNEALECCQISIDMNEGVFGKDYSNKKISTKSYLVDIIYNPKTNEEQIIEASSLEHMPISLAYVENFYKQDIIEKASGKALTVINDPTAIPSINSSETSLKQGVQSVGVTADDSIISYSVNEELIVAYALKGSILLLLGKEDEAIVAINKSFNIAQNNETSSFAPESKKILDEMFEFRARYQESTSNITSNEKVQSSFLDQDTKNMPVNPHILTQTDPTTPVPKSISNLSLDTKEADAENSGETGQDVLPGAKPEQEQQQMSKVSTDETAIDPKAIELFNKGLELQNHHQHEEAIDNFKNAIEIYKDYLEVAIESAKSNYILGYYLESILWSTTTIFRISKESAEGHYITSLSFYEAGKYQEAISIFKRGYELEHKNEAIASDFDYARELLKYRSQIIAQYPECDCIKPESEKLIKAEPKKINDNIIIEAILARDEYLTNLKGLQKTPEQEIEIRRAKLVHPDSLSQNATQHEKSDPRHAEGWGKMDYLRHIIDEECDDLKLEAEFFSQKFISKDSKKYLFNIKEIKKDAREISHDAKKFLKPDEFVQLKEFITKQIEDSNYVFVFPWIYLHETEDPDTASQIIEQYQNYQLGNLGTIGEILALEE